MEDVSGALVVYLPEQPRRYRGSPHAVHCLPRDVFPDVRDQIRLMDEKLARLASEIARRLNDHAKSRLLDLFENVGVLGERVRVENHDDASDWASPHLRRAMST